MPILTQSEVFDIFAAAQAVRTAQKNVEAAKITLEDVRKEAIDFIGGDQVDNAGEPIDRSSAKPLGRLDKLLILRRVTQDSIDAARTRSEENVIPSTE